MNRTRPKQIVIRMSEGEYDKVKRQIEKSGMKQQTYLLKAVTDKTIMNTDGLKALIPDLKRIGVNVNQLAKRSNQGDQVTNEEIHRIGEGLNDVWRLLRQLAQGRVSEKP